MTDIYALWILCEMASGLKLSAHAKSLREFRSKNKDVVLKYDAPEQVRQGWSDSIMGSLFGDSDASANPVQGSGRPEIFMNYKKVNFYFEGLFNLTQEPRQEDVYKVLATKAGQDRAFKKLDTIKNDVLWWEAGAQPPQMLADGEVVMTSAYNGRIFNAAVTEKKNFELSLIHI
mgnify:CR=1 FL=1